MKILFLDVNREGLKIPFTQKRISIPLVVTAITAIFGLPSASAVKTGCAMPEGDFSNSCKDIAIKPYASSDPNVPATCTLTAVCPTMFSGLPFVHNEVFIPANTYLDDVSNTNGTLTHGGKSLSQSTSQIEKTLGSIPNSDSNHCLPPLGSYHKTCETEKKPYVSTDPNLALTDLCQAKVSCKTLNAKRETSVVYFNIKSQGLWHSTHRLENCDGSLVAGYNDQQCQVNDPEQIRRIANENGRSASITL